MQLDAPPGIGRVRYDDECDCHVCRCDTCMEWWPLDSVHWRWMPENRQGKRYPRRNCRACEVERRMAA